jgi:hypothetical protein
MLHMKDKKNLYSIESYICTFTYHIVVRLQKSKKKKKKKKTLTSLSTILIFSSSDLLQPASQKH